MIVVAIIGVILFVVHLRVPDRAAATLKLEAERMVQMLNDCRETAVLTGAPIGVRIAADSYALARYRHAWRPFAAAADSARHVLPAEIELTVARPPADDSPAVVCLPSGEAALPALEMRHVSSAGHYRFIDDSDSGFVAEWLAPPT